MEPKRFHTPNCLSFNYSKKRFVPSILCIQESNFKDGHCGKLRGYKPFNKNRTQASHDSGGVAIYVNDNTPAEEVLIVSPIEAVAVTIECPMKIIICNIYILNNCPFKLTDLQSIVKQLPRPFIIVGDFNSHSPLWGTRKRDKRGAIIEEWLDDPNIVVLNSNEATHSNYSSGTFSSIDLSICSTGFADKIEWSVNSDLHDSDHFPIHIEITDEKQRYQSSIVPTKKWNLSKANWDSYGEALDTLFATSPSIDSTIKYDRDDLINLFTDIIQNAADRTIPKSSGYSHKPSVPWWNDECKQAVCNAKHELHRFQKTSLRS